MAESRSSKAKVEPMVEPEAVDETAPEPEPVEVEPDSEPEVEPEVAEGRMETFEATRPDGSKVQIVRNIDTGEQTLTEVK